MHTRNLDFAAARALIARAIDKAEDIGVRGAVAVVGASGALICASRMDHGGTGGMARARSKAWIAATQQIPSVVHLRRLGIIAPPMVAGFVACSPEAVFPGAGGMPIADERGAVIAGIAASGATVGPFVDYPGADRRKLIADGRPANCEDLLVHYALAIPYEGQHGDDEQRWIDAYGALPDEPGLGMADPPPARAQPEHEWALALADRAMAEAAAHGARVAVAVVDHRGDPIQQDCMDGAPTAGPFVAEAVAAGAATFQLPSEQLDPALAHVLPYRVACVAGGLPVREGERVVAGLGIGGVAPELCGRIAAAALA
ncbi:MAG TPA: heme-binding protein [Solirubrobacteraceae bacterium]|nr:heme-binding protein [Solirubrobacteraceae bacterium]